MAHIGEKQAFGDVGGLGFFFRLADFFIRGLMFGNIDGGDKVIFFPFGINAFNARPYPQSSAAAEFHFT